QDCDIVRAGGFDPGWQWRGALTICPHLINITGVQIRNLTISNSLSYGVQFVSPGNGVLSNATMSNINVAGYAVGVPPYSPWPSYCDGVYGVLARNDAKGRINVSDLRINGTGIIAVPTNGTDLANQSQNGQFTFNFLTLPISVTVQANPPGHAFTVDSVAYTNAQTFSWVQGALHALGTTSPQNSGAGVQDLWTSWSDGGAMAHTITPTASATYTADFTRQFYLTMNTATGGSASPASGWQNSNAVVTISATPAPGFEMAGWSGSGNGSYSGTNAAAAVTMRAPITQTPIFSSLQVQSMNFVQQPGTVLQNALITPEVQVRALGTNGLPLAGAPISLALGSGAGTLAGTLTRVTDAGGIAHFADLRLTLPGPKTLCATAASGPAPPTNSSSFMVIGPVLALAFTTQPGSAVAGLPFGQQPVVKTVDAAGTPTTWGVPASLPVYISLTNGTGLLSGTTSYDIGTSAGNGEITCTDLALDMIGVSNQLVASTVALAPSNTVTGAVLWLDANDPATLTTNGTKVQAWKNKGAGGTTGANLWFTQNTSALQPLQINQMGGRPVVTFSKNGSGYGGGCTYLGNIGLNSYTNSGNQMTCFVVARQRDNSYAWQGPISFSTSGQTDGQSAAGVVILADGSQATPYPFGIQRNHPATPMQADLAAAPLLTPFLLTFVDNAGAATLRVLESTGGARNSSASIVNGISPYKYGITDVAIGARLEPSPTTIDNGWDGDVAEVLVYNSALGATDRAAVETYLSNKWFSASGTLTVNAAVSVPFTVIPEPAGGLALRLGAWYTARQAARRRESRAKHNA
ncbi:MAG: hypothetical protein NTV22_16920, partial [bacterium]|nr:hypothetical protein [bacterium]